MIQSMNMLPTLANPRHGVTEFIHIGVRVVDVHSCHGDIIERRGSQVHHLVWKFEWRVNADPLALNLKFPAWHKNVQIIQNVWYFVKGFLNSSNKNEILFEITDYFWPIYRDRWKMDNKNITMTITMQKKDQVRKQINTP